MTLPITRRKILGSSLILAGGGSPALGQPTPVPARVTVGIRQQIAQATCQLICKVSDNQTVSGTGFFFDFNADLKGKPAVGIITNKHVLNSGNDFYMRHVSKNTSGLGIPLPDIKRGAVMHPDPNVDLCVSFCAGNWSRSIDLSSF